MKLIDTLVQNRFYPCNQAIKKSLTYNMLCLLSVLRFSLAEKAHKHHQNVTAFNETFLPKA